jgi:hypothetical protein
VEASARRVHDPVTMVRVSAAFAEVYDWPTTVAGDEIDAPYAAPTSGGRRCKSGSSYRCKRSGFRLMASPRRQRAGALRGGSSRNVARVTGGSMTKHRTGTREEWLRERLELLKAEKELTHSGAVRSC